MCNLLFCQILAKQVFATRKSNVLGEFAVMQIVAKQVFSTRKSYVLGVGSMRFTTPLPMMMPRYLIWGVITTPSHGEEVKANFSSRERGLDEVILLLSSLTPRPEYHEKVSITCIDRKIVEREVDPIAKSSAKAKVCGGPVEMGRSTDREGPK